LQARGGASLPDSKSQRPMRQARPAEEVDALGLSEQELLRATVWNSPIAYGVADSAGRILLWNPAAERMFGWKAGEVLGGPPPIADKEATVPFESLFEQTLAGDGVVEVEVQCRHRDGHGLDVELSTVPLRDTGGEVAGVLATFTDITRRKVAEAELVRNANQDDLTGLLNRRGLVEQLRQTRARRKRQVAVIALDIDHFKNINDTFGRPAGDQLLDAVGKRLWGYVRPGDIVARLEGAAFAVLMLGVGPADLEHLVARLFAIVSERYAVAGHEVTARVTGGVAVCAGSDDPTEVLRRAEVALYHAKRVNRGGFQVLDDQLDRAFQERAELSGRLLDAVDRDELRLHFQPIIVAASGEVAGIEALVRWQHPQRGLLGPDQFIGLAEESGSISSIGRWVLREACATLKRWIETEPTASDLVVSVNLSMAELEDPNLVGDVEQALKQSGLAAERLHLEVTESVLSTDPELAARVLTELHDLGVWLAIDDFGTGNSSLTALQRFPFQVLKIDRSFVNGIGVRRKDDTIVTATLALAHGLGLSVVAEGVETQEQAEFLRDGGCEELQGYLFGRPAPAAVITPLLDSSRTKPERVA
jgi:diguanylate cyclase (GGDEF)-like protein/PAS domain S-box-containing protein